MNQAGSKNLIAGLEKKKDKFVHILIFIFKVLINLAFCTAVIVLCGVIFGMENCIAGLVLLLGILVFRFTDLDIHASHSFAGIYLIFGILAVFPKLSNLVPTGCDFCINFVGILLIVILACHNVRWFNHSTLVLSYILLNASDVSGISYLKRVLCLLLGATLTALVLYRNRRKVKFENGFFKLFTDFNLNDERSRWQIKLALCVSGAILFATLLGFTKPSWAGIAAMSVTVPVGVVKPRVESRIRANAIGCIVLVIACFLLPASFLTYFGYIGGFCAGFCGKYEGQTAWNSFCALSIAAGTYGVAQAVFYRILNNIFGALFAFIAGQIITQLLLSLNEFIQKIKNRKKI